MEKDWRLTNQIKYLYKTKLFRATFKETKDNDHEHCEFCWSKFSESDDDLHEGYCSLNMHIWICDKCYHDFNKMFKWELVGNIGSY